MIQSDRSAHFGCGLFIHFLRRMPSSGRTLLLVRLAKFEMLVLEHKLSKCALWR